MKTNLTKKCKACEINFNNKSKNKKNSSEFKFPTYIPVSETMRNSVNKLRGIK